MAETTLSQDTIYRARPTLRFAGQEDVRASELLLEMRMDEHVGGMTALELRLSNWASTVGGGAEAGFGADSKLVLGAAIEVYVGEEAGPREIFRGRISCIEMDFKIGSAPEIVVLAEDALQGARMVRRSKLYTEQAPADVARSVASGLGLTPVITALDQPVGVWAQLNESDLAFLRRLLQRFDADVQIVGQELHVSPRKDVKRGAIELQLFSQLGRARVRADLAEQATAVSVRGWNAKDGAAVDHQATSGTNLGPGTGRDGKAVLTEALADRHEHLAQVVVTSADEARAVAEAAFDLRARRFLCADGTAEGNAQLRVGSHVTLMGLDPRFDNTYYVVRTCHRYDTQHGYRTEFSAECAFMGTA